MGDSVRVPPQAQGDNDARGHGAEQSAVPQGQNDRQGVPARVAPQALPGRGQRGRAHHAPFPRKAVVVTAPFQVPSTAQTRQVYFSPALICILGAQEVSLLPGSTGALISLPPLASSISNMYFAFSCSR